MAKKLHFDRAAEKEATDIGAKFMHSTDVVGDMSRAYGRDLSSVRIHTDESAARGAAERGVDAFSTGKDVFFGRGAFDQSDPASRGLLAHELSHSIQQGVGGAGMATAQSAPAGAAQGGLLDWFRSKFGRKKKPEPELNISGPLSVEKNTSDESRAYMNQMGDAINNSYLDEIDRMSTEELREFVMSRKDRPMEGTGSISRVIGRFNNAVASQREYAISKLVSDPGAADLLHSPELQSVVMEQFISRTGQDMKAKAAKDSKESNVAQAFRGNQGYLFAFNTMVNRLLPEDAHSQIISTFLNHGVNAERAADDDPDSPGHHLTRHNYDASAAAVEEIVPSLLSQSPEAQSLYERAGDAFNGVEGFDSPEARSKMLMNNFMLRSVSAALGTASAGNRALLEASRASQQYANDQFSAPSKNSFLGQLVGMFRRKRG